MTHQLGLFRSMAARRNPYRMNASDLVSTALDELLTSGTKLSDILLKIKTIGHFIGNADLLNERGNLRRRRFAQQVPAERSSIC